MKFFHITPDFLSSTAQDSPEAPMGVVVVTKVDDLEPFTNTDLLKLFNAVTGQNVSRFADRKSAKNRTWKALEALEIQETPKEEPAPQPPSGLWPSPDDPRITNKGTHRGANGRVYPEKPTPCRQGTKQAMMVDLLARPEGATLEELMKVTNWNRTTVMSGLGWDMKLHGYKTTRDDNEHYHLVVPEGCTIPPHTPLKKAL